MKILLIDGNEKEASDGYKRLGMETQYEVYEKILIKNSKPFALIKIKEKEFEFDKELSCENAKVLFKKPQWLSII